MFMTETQVFKKVDSLNICIPAFVSQILFLFTSLRLIIYMISYPHDSLLKESVLLYQSVVPQLQINRLVLVKTSNLNFRQTTIKTDFPIAGYLFELLVLTLIWNFEFVNMILWLYANCIVIRICDFAFSKMLNSKYLYLLTLDNLISMENLP